MESSSGMVDLSLSINLNVSPPPNIDDDHQTLKNKYQGAFVDKIKPSLTKHDIENDPVVDEINRMNMENERLTKMLTIVCENYNALQSRFTQLVKKDSTSSTSPPSKRKSTEDDEKYGNVVYSDLQGDSYKRLQEVKTNVSRVFVRTDPSDKTLVVKDGYHWRKYGQKVTRDNPSPRAYYKCSFAPNCPVKKKVQRSVEDCTMVVATYEGEHNHKNPSQAKDPMEFNQNLVPASSPGSNSMPLAGNSNNIELGLVQPEAGRLCSTSRTNVVIPQAVKSHNLVQQLLLEEMASSLTRNPSFTEALAAAISNKILEYDLEDGW